MANALDRVRRAISAQIHLWNRRGRRRRAMASAGEGLSEKLASKVRLVPNGEAFFETTQRCRVVPGLRGVPGSLVLKLSKIPPERWGAEGKGVDGPASRFCNEWAGYGFLAQVDPEATTYPKVWGGDLRAGWILLEDVGGDTLADRLAASDPVQAVEGLRRFGRSLARLHSNTSGREEEYLALRAAAGFPADEENTWGTYPWFRRRIEILQAGLARIGLPVSRTAVVELEDVAARLKVSARAFTHGDCGPENLRLSAGDAWLLDFELGGFRHAFIDAAYVRMLWPTCWHVRALPPDALQAFEAGYREALIPEAAAEYEQNMLVGCAYWLAVGLSFGLDAPTGPGDRSSAIEVDPLWSGISLRRILRQRVRAFERTAAELGGFPSLLETCRALESHLDRIWPDSNGGIPLFPVFDPLRSRNAEGR